MSKLIIDATTGTVLNADNCYVVDASVLTEDTYSDSELCDIAKTGISVAVIGQDTGWGDNAYRYSISYSPLSIKDEAQTRLDAGMYDPDEPEYEAMKWAVKASIDKLQKVSSLIMEDNNTWCDYSTNIMLALEYIMGLEEE